MDNSYYLIQALNSSTAQGLLGQMLALGETGPVSAHRKLHYRTSPDGKKFIVQGDINPGLQAFITANDAHISRLGDYINGTPESWVRTFHGSYLTVDTALLVPDNYGTCNYPFGSAQSLTDEEIRSRLQELKDAGIGWMRTDFEWQHLEPSKGVFNWQYYDRLVTIANEVGIKILANVGYSNNYANGGQGTRVPPIDSQDYADFFAAVVTHYYPMGVTHYEAINEANYKVFFPLDQSAQAPAGIDKYADMLKKAYAAAKAAVPTATILMTGMAPAGPPGGISPPDFLQGLYDRGCKDFFDKVSHHPYEWWRPDAGGHTWANNMIAAIRQVMVNNGDSAKKMWFTELGRPTGGNGNYSSEQVQADMIRASMWESAKRDYVEKMFIYNFKDSKPPTDTTDREHHFGIVRSDGSKKPAWWAVRDVILGG